MEQTITDDAPAPETGAEEALPAPQDDQSAATDPAEPISTTTEGAEDESTDTPAVPEVDEEKLKSFAKGQGVTDLENLSERETNLLKIAYHNNAEFQRTRQKATELEKSLTSGMAAADAAGDQDLVKQLAQEVQTLKLSQSVSSFFDAADVPAEEREAVAAERRALEPVMAKIVNDDPNMQHLVRTGYVSYEQLAAMARGSDTSRDQKLKADGGRDALQKVADKTTAKAVAGSATSSDLSPPADDPFLKGFDGQ